MNTFTTRSTPRKQCLIVCVTFLVLALVALLGLTIGVPAVIFFEVMLLISCLFCLLISRKAWWDIVFQDGNLILHNHGNNSRYTVQSLRASDFTFRQTERQKAKNCCDMKIRDLPFRFDDVQQFSQLEEYIRRNLQ